MRSAGAFVSEKSSIARDLTVISSRIVLYQDILKLGLATMCIVYFKSDTPDQYPAGKGGWNLVDIWLFSGCEVDNVVSTSGF